MFSVLYLYVSEFQEIRGKYPVWVFFVNVVNQPYSLRNLTADSLFNQGY